MDGGAVLSQIMIPLQNIPILIDRAYKDGLHAVSPAPLRPRRKVAVVGIPRSGTSWVGRVLALGRSVSYSYEPEVPFKERYMQMYIPPSASDPEFFTFIDDCINGRLQRAEDYRPLSTAQLLKRPFADNVLVKWVRFPLVLDWIAVNFPELRVLQTIRHPIPLFLSWEQRGWNLNKSLDRIREKPELMDGPLARYRSVIESVEGDWPSAAAFWCCNVTMQINAIRDGWMLREHEWFCLDPESRFRRVFDYFGFEWTPEVDSFLHGSRSERVRGTPEPRDTQAEVHKWEGKVTDSVLREVLEVMAAFDVPVYPGLDPEALVCEQIEAELLKRARGTDGNQAVDLQEPI
ncbi:hypothetical protein ACFLRO_00015 [Bacteroidota bacterium]